MEFGSLLLHFSLIWNIPLLQITLRTASSKFMIQSRLLKVKLYIFILKFVFGNAEQYTLVLRYATFTVGLVDFYIKFLINIKVGGENGRNNHCCKGLIQLTAEDPAKCFALYFPFFLTLEHPGWPLYGEENRSSAMGIACGSWLWIAKCFSVSRKIPSVQAQ